jgi:pyridoxal phosphate enzyme (YggS family)
MLPGPQNCATDAALATRLQALQQALRQTAARCGRTVDSITLVAVSKGQSATTIAAAARLGQRHFGENYLQEAVPKLTELRSLDLVWHYIGRLQANKSRAVAAHFSWVHTIDRLQIAERLAAQRPDGAVPLNVCLQVNVAADDRKAGVAPAAAAALARQVATLPRLRLRGLMCMLPDGLDDGRQRWCFGELRRLMQSLRVDYPCFDTLSMGMSGDFAAAIAEGATMLRIGTAIFGARA